MIYLNFMYFVIILLKEKLLILVGNLNLLNKKYNEELVVFIENKKIMTVN